MIGRVTLTVNYRDMSKKASEFHCDNMEQAEKKLRSINDWSSFILVGVNYADFFGRQGIGHVDHRGHPINAGEGHANHVKDT